MTHFDTRCIAVFTSENTKAILRQGGTMAWKLSAARARTMPYVLCIQNHHNRNRAHLEKDAPHGSAFLVGRISDVTPAVQDPSPGRWMIRISAYATLETSPNVWPGGQGPIRYARLEAFGVSLETLDFRPVDVPAGERQGRAAAGLAHLLRAMRTAKANLAALLRRVTRRRKPSSAKPKVRIT